MLLKTDRACDDFEPSKSAKNKPKLHKVCGYADQGYYEAIYHQAKPAFLVLRKDIFNVYEFLTLEGEVFLPKEYPNEFPYEPYGYYEDSLPKREELF